MARGRVGRPPDSRSEDTRDRILDVARRCFAEYGYGATTNKQLAASAGLTTGAIYHYFSSKQDLYLAVHTEVQAFVYNRFQAAAKEAGETFTAKILAVLEEAMVLNREDPSLASFLVSVRTDQPRHAELARAPELEPRARASFFGEMVDLGIRNGEIGAADRQLMLDLISAMMTGLVTASSGDSETHRRAVTGVQRLVLGSLIQPHAVTSP